MLLSLKLRISRSIPLANAVMVITHRIRLLSLQIEIVNKIFLQNLDNPPLYKNHPPIAGAIYWERSLFFRIKHTILRFQEVAEILDSDRGREVRGSAGTAPCGFRRLRRLTCVRSSSLSDPGLQLRSPRGPRFTPPFVAFLSGISMSTTPSRWQACGFSLNLTFILSRGCPPSFG